MYRFDNERREVIFDNYKTPTPWMNYLSNGTLHAMISQAGGGTAWHRSPQIWRINHYRFFICRWIEADFICISGMERMSGVRPASHARRSRRAGRELMEWDIPDSGQRETGYVRR